MFDAKIDIVAIGLRNFVPVIVPHFRIKASPLIYQKSKPFKSNPNATGIRYHHVYLMYREGGEYLAYKKTKSRSIRAILDDGI